MLTNPPIITAAGDIQIHNQGATELAVTFKNSLGAARNVSARTMWFEVSNGHRIAMTNGATTDEKLITILQHALDDVLGQVMHFAIVDETDPKHVIEWQGNIVVTGWLG